MYIGAFRFAVSLLTVTALSSATAASAEEHEQYAQGPPRSASTGALTSATNSQPPSDHIAYRHFIILASVRDDASPADRLRRDALVKRIGLSPADEASLQGALNNVRERLEAASVGMPQTFDAAASASSAVRLRSRVDDVFSGVNERIRSALSEDGWRRLNRFVRDQIKPQTRVYGASR